MMKNTMNVLPKVELHRHLEGSIRPETYFELARSQNIPLGVSSLKELLPAIQYRPGDERTLPAFLQKLKPMRRILTDRETLCRVTYEAFEDAAKDGALYVELRFSASHMLLQGMAEQDIAAGLSEGLHLAKKKLGIGACLIAGITRELGAEMAEKITSLAIRNIHNGILALDLFGDERIAPELFFMHFSRARDAGLCITVHAGEGGGAHNIRTAVEQLGAARIGHGVRIVEDASVIHLVKDKNVLLEMCPTSNVQTGAIANLWEHPLKRMLELGVHVSISTDDPQFSNTTLAEEYRIARDELGLSDAQLMQITNIAADHIFDIAYIPTLKKALARAQPKEIFPKS